MKWVRSFPRSLSVSYEAKDTVGEVRKESEQTEKCIKWKFVSEIFLFGKWIRQDSTSSQVMLYFYSFPSRLRIPDMGSSLTISFHPFSSLHLLLLLVQFIFIPSLNVCKITYSLSLLFILANINSGYSIHLLPEKKVDECTGVRVDNTGTERMERMMRAIQCPNTQEVNVNCTHVTKELELKKILPPR